MVDAACVTGRGRFLRDRRGNIAVLTAILSPVVFGAVGLAIDVGTWERAHKHMQQAADGAAASAAVGFAAGGALGVNALGQSVASSYGFTNGVNSVTVTVNQPPSSGSHTATTGAVEVIISQPQNPIFSAMLGIGQVPVNARAVAIGSGKACVLALDQTATVGIGVQGSPSVNAVNCNIYSDSNTTGSVTVGGSASVVAMQVGAAGGVSGTTGITASQGITTYGSIIGDPYGAIPMPTYSGCDYNNTKVKSTITLSPGVYCGGLALNAGANVTMSPGVYVFDSKNANSNDLTVNGQATLSGTGVTLFFTCSTCGSSGSGIYASAKIAGGATVTLSAPTTGALSGILFFGDRNEPIGTGYDLEGGTAQSLTGAVYLPKGALKYAGGASGTNGCSQIISDTMTFLGNSYLYLNCTGAGTKLVGGSAQVVE